MPHLPPLTVLEAARLMGKSPRTIIRWFEHEAGTIVIDSPERVHKRRRRLIRIPRDVFQRVAERHGIARPPGHEPRRDFVLDCASDLT